MTDKTILEIYREVLKIDREGCENLQKVSANADSGGEQRGLHGENNENIIKYIIYKIGELYGIRPIIKKGEKKDKIFVHNEGGRISISLDWHVYIGTSLLIVMEIKSYMDTTMLKRLLYEAKKLKTKHPNVVTAIIQFENGLGEEPYGFIKFENDVDFLLTLTDRKRNSHIKRFSSDDGLIKNNEDFKTLCTTIYNIFGKELIATKETTELLGVGPKTIRRLESDGKTFYQKTIL